MFIDFDNGPTFGSLQQFMGAVLQADLSVSKPAADGTRVVTFVPPAGSKPCPELCRPITFPWSLTQATLKMPSVGGKTLVDQPSLAYDGPFRARSAVRQCARALVTETEQSERSSTSRQIGSRD